jgi:hypothetical protein
MTNPSMATESVATTRRSVFGSFVPVTFHSVETTDGTAGG